MCLSTQLRALKISASRSITNAVRPSCVKCSCNTAEAASSSTRRDVLVWGVAAAGGAVAWGAVVPGRADALG